MPRNNKHSTVPKWEVKWEQELFTGCETCVEAAIVDGSVEKIPEVKAKTYEVLAVETARKAFGESLFANMVTLEHLQR